MQTQNLQNHDVLDLIELDNLKKTIQKKKDKTLFF